MTDIRWSLAKSQELKKARGISFEEIIRANLVGVQQHTKRKNQKVMLFEFKGYIWVVPFVTKGNEIFLKTLFPSRQFTKKWKRGELS
ncbi:MAG: toxin [Elusimicrobia bacterium]|nr:MAG: toxin [Elusimicrobiota bacterium]